MKLDLPTRPLASGAYLKDALEHHQSAIRNLQTLGTAGIGISFAIGVKAELPSISWIFLTISVLAWIFLLLGCRYAAEKAMNGYHILHRLEKNAEYERYHHELSVRDFDASDNALVRSSLWKDIKETMLERFDKETEVLDEGLDFISELQDRRFSLDRTLILALTCAIGTLLGVALTNLEHSSGAVQKSEQVAPSKTDSRLGDS